MEGDTGGSRRPGARCLRAAAKCVVSAYNEGMQTRLPANLIPVQPLPSNDERAASSQLGRYLQASLRNGSAVLAYDMVEPFVSGAITLAAATPFDPNERLKLSRGDVDPPISLVEGVLRLSNIHLSAHRALKNPPPTMWPSDPQEFGELLARGVSPDTQLLAGLLIATGCNPWVLAQESQVPAEIVLAIRLGYGPLLARFLELPGALSAQAVADSVVMPANRYQGSPAPMWQELFHDKQCAAPLEVLLSAGARPSPKQVTSLLPEATPEAVQALARHARPTLSDRQSQQLRTLWKERARKQAITPDQAQSMSAALWGEEASSDMSAASVEIARLVAIPWGQEPSGSSAHAYDFMGDTGIETLNARTRLKAGPMAGHWSMLAAAALSRLRQGNALGARGWSTAMMLKRKFDHEQRHWVRADPSQSPWKGSLAPAMGFDWRPGISVDGILALALYGQRGDADGQNEPARQQNAKELAHDIQGFAQAAGIDDVRAWATEHLPSAARFTLHALRRPAAAALAPMVCAWSNIAQRDPELLSGLTDTELGAQLLLILGDFAPGASGSFHGFKHLTQGLFPGLKEDELTDPGTSGPRRRAALAVRLSRDLPGHFEKFNEVFEQSGELSADDLEIVSSWISSNASQIEEGKWRAAVEERQMELTTAKAVPSPSSRGLRL